MVGPSFCSRRGACGLVMARIVSLLSVIRDSPWIRRVQIADLVPSVGGLSSYFFGGSLTCLLWSRRNTNAPARATVTRIRTYV
jgi:hypothetical protein